MELEHVKQQVTELTEGVKAIIPCKRALDDWKEYEIYEDGFEELLFKYCQEHYEKEFPPIDSLTGFDRRKHYLYLVAIEKEDVFELLHFWKEQVRNTTISRKEFGADLKDEVDYFQSERGRLPWY